MALTQTPNKSELKKNHFEPAGCSRVTILKYDHEMRRLAWSADGRLLAAASTDKTIQLWDVTTGQSLVPLSMPAPAASLAWAPAGSALAAGSQHGAIRLWDRPSAKFREFDKRHHKAIAALAWAPAGTRLVSAGYDNTIGLWEAATGNLLRLLRKHHGPVRSLAWSREGTVFASASADRTLCLWSKDGEWQRTLRHTAQMPLYSLAWSPDDHWLLAGSSDGTVRLWEPATGRVRKVLEGHTRTVDRLSFIADGRLLVSQSIAGEIRLWRYDGGELELLAKYDVGEPSDQRFPGLTVHPHQPVMASLSPAGRSIEIWKMDFAALLGKAVDASSAGYATAKIVLLGNSGVGKTALGWWLTRGEFRSRSSTHGQQFWMFDRLHHQRTDGTECETVLWDFAGQPDYRLIHTLALDDANLALVLFDPADMEEPLRGVDVWLKALASRKTGYCPVILVGARSDRGQPSLTDEELRAFCDDRGIKGGYIPVSAASNQGKDLLIQRITEMLAWDELVATQTDLSFKRIKDYVLGLKADAKPVQVLTDLTGLHQQLSALDTRWHFTNTELLQAVGQLERHGYLRVLRTVTGEQNILLAPELLNNLASSLILKARRDPEGAGLLNEASLLADHTEFVELNGFDQQQQASLLNAAVVLCLECQLCFCEVGDQATFLVFPELVNRVKSVGGQKPIREQVSFTVGGAVDNIYTAVVVVLGYTDIFTRAGQWKNQAEFRSRNDEICGLKKIEEREGEIDLVLYFSVDTGQATQTVFQGLIERIFVEQDAKVTRYPPLECESCGYVLEKSEVVRRTRERLGFIFCSQCGHKKALFGLAADQERELSDEDWEQVQRQRTIAKRRNQFEVTLHQLRALLEQRHKGVPVVFNVCLGRRGKLVPNVWLVHRFQQDLEQASIRVTITKDNGIPLNLPERESEYFLFMFDLILSLYEISSDDRGVIDLRKPLQPEHYGDDADSVLSTITTDHFLSADLLKYPSRSAAFKSVVTTRRRL